MSSLESNATTSAETLVYDSSNDGNEVPSNDDSHSLDVTLGSDATLPLSHDSTPIRQAQEASPLSPFLDRLREMIDEERLLEDAEELSGRVQVCLIEMKTAMDLLGPDAFPYHSIYYFSEGDEADRTLRIEHYDLMQGFGELAEIATELREAAESIYTLF